MLGGGNVREAIFDARLLDCYMSSKAMTYF